MPGSSHSASIWCRSGTSTKSWMKSMKSVNQFKNRLDTFWQRYGH